MVLVMVARMRCYYGDFLLSCVFVCVKFPKHQNRNFENFSYFLGDTQNEKNSISAIFLPEYLSLDSSTLPRDIYKYVSPKLLKSDHFWSLPANRALANLGSSSPLPNFEVKFLPNHTFGATETLETFSNDVS